MNYNKTQILFILLFVLGVLYVANTFSTKSVYDLLVGSPAKISFILIDPPKDECEKCVNEEDIINMIDVAHDIKYKSRNVPYNSAISQKYIEMYSISNLPALIVSGDIENKKVISALDALSADKREGVIVIENILPYYNIESGEVKGVISAILIKDETCKNCFDVNEYIASMKQFGMDIDNVTVYDIASVEGNALTQKYTIQKVPTVIFSPGTGDYINFLSSWSNVGTVEKDGWLVFREVQKMSAEYKNI